MSKSVPLLTEREKQHLWKDIKAKLLIRKLIEKVRAQRRELRLREHRIEEQKIKIIYMSDQL